ncbi:MAG TPA: AI-2E family transporter [Actinophytocola sp.]|uniref:AI-2E family transporter n=1 Tax=Actinophytocola sp. TaxID=1872138 RepID=UPI002DBDE2E2|nr:AI-2E family transporter [Actinophytocola sp.]HEU5470471.1 AI-2E family transporter [Actinophytocola sp.]
MRDRAVARVVLIAIGLVLATLVAILIVLRVQRVLIWMVIAVFLTAALYPAVDWVQRRVTRGHRLPATLLVFVVVLGAIAGLLAAFAVPLAQQGSQLAGQLPQLISEARAGRGPVGEILVRVNALEFVQQNESRIREVATGLSEPALNLLRAVATGIIATIAIIVLSFLAVLEGPKVIDGGLGLLQPRRAERLRRLGKACARTVTEYITGNLIISVICGVLTYVVLKLLGVPFAELIALFVAIADLIPLVGATLGALVAGIAGFIHSVPAGIIVIVFFVLYQQLENHVLQPFVFSRTVKLNPLTVIVAILIGAELLGILGALLAIPAAGIIQLILRDIWSHRRGAAQSTSPLLVANAAVAGHRAEHAGNDRERDHAKAADDGG